MTICTDFAWENGEIERNMMSFVANFPGFAFTLRISPDGHGSFPFASPGIEKLYGLKPEDVKDDMTPLHALAHCDDAPRIMAGLAESARTMTPLQLEYRVCRPGLPACWTEFRAAPLRADDGSMLWHGTMLDIDARKCKEESLRVGEERMRLFFESQLVGMAISSPEKGWIQVNDKICAMLGYSREELACLTWATLTYPEDLSADTAQFEGMLNGEIETYTLEKRFVRKDGSIVFTNLAVGCVRRADRSVDYVMAMLEDISGRKAVEKALRESRQSLAEAQRITHVGSWEMNLVDNVLSWSDEIYRIFEIDPQQFGASYEAFMEAVHPDDRSMVDSSYKASLETRASFEIEHRLLLPDGRIKYVHERCETYYGDNGTPLRSIGVVQDITERKIMENSLRESQQLLAEAQRIAHVGSWECDIASDTHNWSDELFRIFEIDPLTQGASYKGCIERIHPDDREAVARAYLDSIETGSPYQSEHRLLLPDGRVKYVRERGESVCAADGTPVRSLGMMQDITEFKHYEAAREAALAEAMQLAKLRSDFLAHMSHELRTPLNGILGYAQIMQRDKTLGERNVSALNVIRQSGEHLLALIDDTLDLTRIESGRLELVRGNIPLHRFLRIVAEIVGVRARQKRLAFSCALASDLPQGIRGDEKRLRQVLLNLLSNAVKFTDRGHVVLHVSRAGASRISFAVEDSGIGVAESELETIFQPFEQTEHVQRQFGGSGLGLAISRQLVRLMGGDITVESRVGEGSTFRFELELPEVEIAPSSLLSARTGSDYAGPRRKVLAVDDVAENRAVLIDLLAPMGFDMIEACDGIEALELARSASPDIILMDLVMPRMCGLEAIRQLRLMPDMEQVPIIVLSASASGGDEAVCLECGANAFLLKPIDQDELLAQIAVLLQLEWAVMPSTGDMRPLGEPAESLIAPPAGEVKALHKLAQLGNMRDILRYTERIAGLDPRYHPFAARLRQLANAYQSKAILAFIEEYL